MRRYIEHIKSKEPHERRRHAMVWAGIITGVFAVAWLMNFSARLNSGSVAPQTAAAGDSSQTAAAMTAIPNDQPGVEVSTTSVYSY